MVRLLVLLLEALARRLRQPHAAWSGNAPADGGYRAAQFAHPRGLAARTASTDADGHTRVEPGELELRDGEPEPPRRLPRRRIPVWARWTAVAVVVGLIFRRAVAWLVLVTLSAALHLIGINAGLPSVQFGWPWQTIRPATTTNTDLGPWVLQKIEGISRPALGQANFSFYFTHKVSESIGPWPCWYASTFYAAGHASATVDLNPGSSWWAPGSGHYQLQTLTHPQLGKPGTVAVVMALPRPQLPQSVHDVTIDNTLSRPIDTQHSWTYPGFGCGALLHPQFSPSVLYAQAQQIAFSRATRSPSIIRPLISSAETEATQTIRNNFIQPTVNSFGYTLSRFTIHWVAGT